MKHPASIAAICAVTILSFHTPLRSQSREQTDRVRDAVQVVRDLMQQSDVRIPQYLLERAEAIVVIPDMIRGGFVIGAKHGKGIVSVRNRMDGRWSPPGFVRMTGGSVGWQIGAQSVDLVLLVMNPNGVNKLLSNRFTLGADVSVTAGPVGRSAAAATDISLESEILGYSRARGLFAGATFEGVSLRPDDDANTDFYGVDMDLRDIVLDTPSDLRVPSVASLFTDTMRDLARPASLRQSEQTVDRVGDLPPWIDSVDSLAVRMVMDRPGDFYGRRVAITASVEDVYSSTIFGVDDDPIYATDRKIVVINPRPAYRLDSGSVVTVVGTISKFDRNDIDRSLGGWTWDVSPATVDSFKAHPVLIADSIYVRSRPPAALLPIIEPAYNLRPVGFGGPVLIASEVSLHPKTFYGREVMVTASVDGIYSRTVFSVDDDRMLTTGRQVLVVAPGLVRPVDANLELSVIGTVMKFDRGDIERRFRDYKFDVPKELRESIDDMPVIIATSIRASDGTELLGARTPRR